MPVNAAVAVSENAPTPIAANTMAFGSTMILSQAVTRTTDDDSFVFDPRSPYVVFWVIDPVTGEVHADRVRLPEEARPCLVEAEQQAGLGRRGPVEEVQAERLRKATGG